MINFAIGPARFNYRVAAVCLHQEHVLAVKPDDMDFWFLPGGRVEMLEDSAMALRRELREELGVEAEVGRLLWLVENFFGGADSPYHELCLYYLVPLVGFPALCQIERPLICRDNPHLCLQWQPLATLERINLLPSFLPERLRDLPNQPAHIIHHDVPA